MDESTDTLVRNGRDGAPVNYMIDLVPPETPFLDNHCPDSTKPAANYANCPVSQLVRFFRLLRVLPTRQQAFCWRTRFCPVGLVTCFYNFYFLLVLFHTSLWVCELLLHLRSAMNDPSLANLRTVLYNCRYAFIVFKSTFLLICLRIKSEHIVVLSKAVSLEFVKCRTTANTIVKSALTIVIVILLFLSILLEICDLLVYDMDFYGTMMATQSIMVLNRQVETYQILSVWYTVGVPVNIAMNVAMLYFAVLVLSVYFCWGELNQRLKHDPVYLMGKFEADWDRLRQLVEQADDQFSIAIFISWVCDIVCAVGYLGSIVIYSGGSPREQVYTVIGFFLHAIWYPGCYLIPCILFDEKMMKTRQIVLSSAHKEMACQQNMGKPDQERTLRLNLILQIVSHRPVAFTAWKFFYVTRNVILTISTILVSYALVLVQLIGRKSETQSDNATMAIQLNASTSLHINASVLFNTSSHHLNASILFNTSSDHHNAPFHIA